MTRRFLILFMLLAVQMATIGQAKSNHKSVNPSGSYTLNSKTVLREGETFRQFGNIQVKLLLNSHIAVSLYVCKGAPGYNSGSFVDTLYYANNIAVYARPEYDSTCSITLTFKKSGLTLVQNQGDLNFGCGFGHGVFADGFYKKTSNKIPIIKDQMID